MGMSTGVIGPEGVGTSIEAAEKEGLGAYGGWLVGLDRRESRAGGRAQAGLEEGEAEIEWGLTIS